MKKVMYTVALVVFYFSSTSFSSPLKDKINWITFDELSTLYAKQPKPVLIDLYTSWCGWCKEMDRTTYRNEKLAGYINEHYYAVKYDAESKAPVIFNNKKYSYNSQYRANDLAIMLTGGRLEYPTTVFLPVIDAQPAPLAGYMKAKEMEAPLRYFAEGAYTKKTFIQFNQSLKKSW
jgi:thioredoxin-related protein